MTDEEIIEVVSALKANDKTMKDSGISDNLWGKAVECIKFLQFENAELTIKNEVLVYDIENLIWREKASMEFERLESENAALRERLAHSLELPYMEQAVSRYGTEDTVLYYMENGKLQQECFNNNKFPEQLQAKLAELKEEEEKNV